MKNNLPGSQGEHHLQAHFNSELKAQNFYDKQMLSYLAGTMQEFIRRQEMVFIATADAKGECDSSLRSGEEGFMVVIDEKRLAYAEYKGNGVMASMGNIHENPHIGLLFLDFIRDKVGLHINGKAAVVTDIKALDEDAYKALCERDESVQEKRVAWVLIEVEEAYIHCSKNIPLFDKKQEGSCEPRPVDYFELS